MRGVWCLAVAGLFFMSSAGEGMAGPEAGALRLSCLAPTWIDGARLSHLCLAVGAGMGAALGREVRVVEGAADVALEVIRLDEKLVVARLHWPGAAPGPEVELGVVDAGPDGRAYGMLAASLLEVSPPP